MEQELDIKSYVDVLKRRYIALIALSLGVFALVAVVVYLLPLVYRAEAKILVESQQIPSDLAQATVTAKAVERIQVLQQRMMTRDNLLSIAREFNLFPKDRYNYSPSEIIDEMRASTNIEPIVVGLKRRRNAPTIAFTVSFEYRNPIIAARVANKFVELILEQNIRSRTNRAVETRKFFERQLRSQEQRLANLEARIVKFKNDNKNSLPDSLNYRRSLLSRLQSEVSEINRKLSALDEEKKLWQARMRNNAIAPALDPNASLSDKELERLQTLLVQLRGLYSDNHPEVRKIKAQIDALENSFQKSSPQSKKSSKNSSKKKVANKDSTVKFRITSQLSLIEQQQKTLLANKAALEKRTAKINKSIVRTPEVEVLLQTLLNEYQSLQAQNRQVTAKMNLATVGQKLEEGRQAERFEVIEQATAPSEPIKPRRVQILMAGSFASIAAGIGIVILLELLDQSVRGASGLERRLHIRPILAIPYVETIAEKKARRKKLIIFLSLFITLVVVVLIAIDRLYLPLDLIFQKVLQQINL